MRIQEFVPSLLLVGLLTGTALAQEAAQPFSLSRTVYLPVVGLASSETAQVNVVNLASSAQPVNSGGTAPSGGNTASCTGAITFYDISGSTVTSSASFTIGTGQIFSATLPYSQISTSSTSASASSRTAIRAVVTSTGTASLSSPCSLASNIETFDTATGVTHVHVEGGTLPLAGLLPVLQSLQR
jgi:hypothetical protein